MNEQIALAIEYLDKFGEGLDAYVAKKNIRTTFGIPMGVAEEEYKLWRRRYNKQKNKHEDIKQLTHDEKIANYVTRCSFDVTKEQVLEIKKCRESGMTNRAEIAKKVGLLTKDVNTVLAFFSNSGILKKVKKVVVEEYD